MSATASFSCTRLKRCRICGGDRLVDYLDLGEQPPSNSFPKPDEIAAEQRFPLVVALCTDCGLSQLRDIVAAEDIFDDYAYLSSSSGALRRHYQGMVDALLRDLGPARGAVIADIGCNDGITLKCYPPARYRLVGIEPSSAGDYARAAGLHVVPEFFNLALAKRLRDEIGPAALITATNVVAHIDDIGSLFEGVAAWLDDDGVFVAEFPYLVDTIDGLYFDTVYHEHLSYLSLTPLARLFADIGLKAVRVERQEIGASGPALRLFVARTTSSRAADDTVAALLDAEAAWGLRDPEIYHAFARRVASVRTRILEQIESIRRDGGRVGCYTAPAKGNTLLNYLGVGPDTVLCVAENNDLKIGRLTPGTHIPIVGEDDFSDAGITHALLLAWNYLDFFLEQSPFIESGGRFLVPLPEPVIRP